MAQQIARYFNPVLTALKKLGGSARPSEVCATVAQDLNLKDAALEETLESGQSRFENKVAWVRLYLVLTGYIDRSRRGVWTLTDKGRNSGRLSDEEIQSLLLEIQRNGKHSGDEIAAVSTVPTAGTDSLDDEEEAPEEIPYASQLLALLRSLPAPVLSDCANDSSESRALSKLRLRAEAGMEELTVLAHSKSIHLSHSRFCFSVSDIPAR